MNSLIRRNDIYGQVLASMYNNRHVDSKIAANHDEEHRRFIKMILDAPAVEARPVVHARWIYFRDAKGFKQCKCSECLTSYGCLDTPYCPNCSATMDLESEGKDE